MGLDHSLSCRGCKETLLNVARNCKLYRDKESLNLLQAFLNKHADHDLVFDADDNWVRVPKCTIYAIDRSEDLDPVGALRASKNAKKG